jgi:hypothetical protein
MPRKRLVMRFMGKRAGREWGAGGRGMMAQGGGRRQLVGGVIKAGLARARRAFIVRAIFQPRDKP